jgi:hypothetical protein
MRFLPSGRVRLTALIAVAVGLAAGGIAYASIPDGNGVIHGCYKTVGGALRVIDTGAGGVCNASEKPLNWNQNGPKGATGPTGRTGPTGPAGATMATSVTAISFVSLSSSSTGTTLATLNLPAGSFVLFGRAEILSDGAVNDYLATCALSAGADTDTVSVTGPTSVSGLGVAWLNVLHTFTSPGSATLVCEDSVTQPAAAGRVRITAIQVTQIS